MTKSAALLNKLDKSLERKSPATRTSRSAATAARSAAPARPAPATRASSQAHAVVPTRAATVARPAAPVTAAPAEPTRHPLRGEAEAMIYRAVPWAAGVGFVPSRLLSSIAVITVQVRLVRDLSNLYGMKFSEHAVKSVVTSLLGSGVTAVLAGGSIGASLPSVPIVGPALSFVATPLLAAATTIAIGKLFAAHFESGGTLLHLDAKSFDREFERELSAFATELKRAAASFAAELKP